MKNKQKRVLWHRNQTFLDKTQNSENLYTHQSHFMVYEFIILMVMNNKYVIV